jgi:peptide/nickel transport system substrate-binding protein
MHPRTLRLTPALTLAPLLLSLVACGDTPPASQVAEGVTEAVSATCGETLARVESFLGPVPSSTTDPVVAGGIVDLAGGMNAFVSADFMANQHQIYLNLMTLVRFDDDYQLQPYLAESWSLDEGGSTLTFRIRPDVMWHDGTPTTASDVAFTFERLVDSDTGFPNASAFSKYRSVEIVDPLTVRFVLEPHATALAAWRTVAIMPEHILGAVPAAELGAQPFGTQCPVGNGPFRFVEYVEGQQWHFAANPRFPDALGGPPAIADYVYRIVPEETTLHLELLSGGVDLFVAPSPDVGLSIQAGGEAKLVHYPFRQSAFVAWNGRRPHLSDARVRTALALGTNRQEIVNALLGGFGQIANTGVPPMHLAFDPTAGADLGYDPIRAAQLLDAAGWTDADGDGMREDANGTPLRVEILFNQGNGVRKQIAEIMQAHLAQVGVDVVPTVLDWGALLGRVMDPESRDFDGVVMGWLPEFEMDESGFFHSEKINEPLAWAGLQDEALDALMDAISDAPTKEDAVPLWAAFQQRIAELQPFTYLYYQERLDGVSNRMAQIPMDARGEWAQIMEWRIEEPVRTLARR